MKKLLTNIVGLEGESGPHRVSHFDWEPELFKFRATVHHGIPGFPTCISYDPLQRLLAIGTKGGFVKIFGKPGVEVVVNQYPNPINHLQFVANFGRLAIVHGNNICELVNLNTKRSLGNINFGSDKISVIYQLPCSPYLAFGMGSGMIYFSDSAKATLSTYSITHKHFNLEKPGPVTGLQTHPTDSNIMLISHALGNLVEWNIAKRQVVRKYLIGSSSLLSSNRELGHLKTATWHPMGKKLIAGYSNGDMLVWQRNKPDFAFKRYVITSDSNKRPIKKIFWSRFESHNILCVLGGTSITNDPHVVSIRYKKNLTLLPIIGTNGNSEIEKEIIDFAICLPSNLPCSIEPKSIITISSTSTISVFRPDELGRISYIPPPPSLQLQTSTITSTLFCNVSKSFLNDLMNTSDISYNPQSWPILGGYTSLQPQNCSDILITGHADGLVYFWDISSIQFNLLYAINVSNFSQSSDVAIQTVDLCITSRILAISCKNGETFIFFFRLKPSIITQALNLKSSSAGVPQVTSRTAISDKLQDNNNNINVQMNNNNNYMNNHNNISIVEQVESRVVQTPIPQVEVRNENPKSEEQTEERTRSKSKSSSPTVKTEPKFNWEQFFIAASIDAASAKNYAKKFEDNKITEDLIFELDNDMMDIAGVTIGGDKIRILKFIKLCKNDPTLLAPFKERRKKRKKKHSENDPDRPRRHRDPNRPSRSKKETDSSSESSSSTTPRSSNGNLVELSNNINNNNNNNNIISPVVANNNNINSSNNNNLINNNNNINNNSNNNIANMSNSNVNKNNQSKQDNPDVKVDLLINSEENISEMTLKSYKDGMMPAGFQLKVQYSFKNQISRIRIASSLSKLAVGDIKGNVALVDISTGSILLYKTLGGKSQTPVAWLSFDDRVVVEKTAHKKALEAGLYVGLEDGHIYYLALKTGQVENIPIEQLSSNNSTLFDIKLLDGNGSPVAPAAEDWDKLEEEEDLPAVEEFVVKNLDEVKAKKKDKLANRIHGPLTNEDRKFMVVCFDNFISIFSLPSYQLYSSYECRNRPVSANVAQIDGNNCLVVFFSSGDVEVLALMDLHLITSLSSALQKIGVQYNPYTMKDDVNCSLDGRFVVLSKFQEVIRGSLMVHENLLGLPHSIPSLFVPDVPLIDREKELYETYHSAGIQTYPQLFGKYVSTQVEKKAEGVPQPQSRSMEQVQTQKPKYETKSEKIVKGVTSGISEVKEVMSQNMNLASLRQERLEEMLISTNKLASKSSGFADAASALAAKEKSKKWWQ